MTDEKLIEEAVKAVLDAWQVRTMRPVDERLSLAETAVRVALAVVEKAHASVNVTEPHSTSVTDRDAPTDDERTRIEQSNDIAYTVIEVAQNKAPDEFVTLDFRYGIADALWNAGYRKDRPEPQGEPSDAPTPEEWREHIKAERLRQSERGYNREHDARHGVDHLLTWAQDYARRGKMLASAALIEAARELLSQGEPSDAVTIPRPHVPYGPVGIPEHEADAAYLEHAAGSLESHYEVGGSNVRATVVGILRDVATTLRAAGEVTP